MGLSVLQNQTIDGIVVENATIRTENVSVETGGEREQADAQNQTSERNQTDDGQPAMSADTAVLGSVNLTSLDVSGLSVGKEPAGEPETPTETTPANNETTTTTPVEVETTTTPDNETMTTTPAEAGNRTIAGETTTTTAGEKDG
ncbi:hypothetical protein BRC82_06950 [Halobacteriales archaeon QS_1_67_19]|nr:MAG: hypothetical protein BRC82_06950 [Halobacteriales archaeon QS_1_67_19]